MFYFLGGAFAEPEQRKSLAPRALVAAPFTNFLATPFGLLIFCGKGVSRTCTTATVLLGRNELPSVVHENAPKRPTPADYGAVLGIYKCGLSSQSHRSLGP